MTTAKNSCHLGATGRRQGDENRFDSLSSDDGGQGSAVAEDLYPTDEAANLCSIVIDETNDLIRQRRIPLYLAE